MTRRDSLPPAEPEVERKEEAGEEGGSGGLHATATDAGLLLLVAVAVSAPLLSSTLYAIPKPTGVAIPPPEGKVSPPGVLLVLLVPCTEDTWTSGNHNPSPATPRDACECCSHNKECKLTSGRCSSSWYLRALLTQLLLTQKFFPLVPGMG